MSSLLLAALLFPSASIHTSVQESELAPLEGVRTADGRTLEATKGKLWVPENRRDSGSRKIMLAFGVLESTAEEPGPPIVYLHGGPGGSATHEASDPAAVSRWAQFLDLGPVILLDQRGCGRSDPDLTVETSEPPSREFFLDRASLARDLASMSREVKARLEEEGVDYTGYDTEASADDVDDLREFLGYEKIRLLGFSYGTHLGLSVIRRHGKSVESAVLIGVEGPDETNKLPSAYSTLLARISALIAADPAVGKAVPDFEALLARVLVKLEKEPIEVEIEDPRTGAPLVLPVGPEGLRMILFRDIGDTSDLPVFPRLLTTIERGDPSVLRWFVQKRYPAQFPTLVFTMDTASGCSRERAAQIEREAPACLLGNVMNFTFPEVDAIWEMPVLGDDFRSPLVTKVRTLFLSGTLDANTPPYQAERMRWGFSDAVHLVQENGGHEDWLRNPKVGPVLHDFFAGKDVSGRDVDMPPLRFIPVEGAPGALTHPSLSN